MSFHINPVQFGWTQQQVRQIDRNPEIPATHPLKFHVALTQVDVDEPARIAQLVADHLKPGLEKSRAFVLTNTLETLGSQEAVHSYTQKILKMAQDINKPRFTRDSSYQFTQHLYLHPVTGTPSTVANRSTRQLSQTNSDPLISANFPFHYDDQSIEMFALIYGGNRDIYDGGYPMIADIVNAEESGSLGEESPRKQGQLNIYQDSVSSQGVPFESKYSYELDYLDLENDMPVLFLNNTKGEGVAHRGKPFKTGNNPVRKITSYGVIDRYRPIGN